MYTKLGSKEVIKKAFSIRDHAVRRARVCVCVCTTVCAVCTVIVPADPWLASPSSTSPPPQLESIKLDATDGTIMHVLAYFYYAMANLSWVERNAVKLVFGKLPEVGGGVACFSVSVVVWCSPRRVLWLVCVTRLQASFEQALEYFMMAERTGWLAAWLVGWLLGWLVGCLVGWLVGWWCMAEQPRRSSRPVVPHNTSRSQNLGSTWPIASCWPRPTWR